MATSERALKLRALLKVKNSHMEVAASRLGISALRDYWILNLLTG